MQKITPFLWFDDKAEEAANLYVSLFPNSEILSTSRYSKEAPGETGSVMSITFRLAGEEFMALNGGPTYSFSPAISFFVNCETQEEIDLLWERLSEGGEQIQCGWLTDKFGVTWQIVPSILGRLMGDPDPAKAGRVTEAMLKMTKLEIEGLERAYEGA